MKALEYNKDSALETANIRPAPKAFEREGTYLHELVWKDGPWAIYRYRFIKSEKPAPHWKYEAVILRIGKPHPKSEDRRLREALPSNSDWGSWGWSLNTLEKAQEQIADQRIKRGEVIEANYYSHFKNSVPNFRNAGGLSQKTTIPPREGANDRRGEANLEGVQS
jgi:hypothetical protein